MKKVLFYIAALCITLCFLLVGCSIEDAGDNGGQTELQTTASVQENSEKEQRSGGEDEEIIPDCEFYVIKNGGHEFYGQPFEDEMSYILPYLDRQLNNEATESEEIETMVQMKIGDTAVTVAWEENESVEALKDLCQDGPLTIQMSMYGGFEQVGPIGQSLPRDDSQTTTQAGDIVLYSGNQIVIFYGSNSWAYTRLGRITDKSAQEMAELLGNGDVTITIER